MKKSMPLKLIASGNKKARNTERTRINDKNKIFESILMTNNLNSSEKNENVEDNSDAVRIKTDVVHSSTARISKKNHRGTRLIDEKKDECIII